MGRYLSIAFLIATISVCIAPVTAPASAQTGTIIASDNFDRPDESPFGVGGNWGRTVAGNYDGFAMLTASQVTSATNEGIYYWQGPGTFDSTRQFARQRVVQKDGEMGLVLLGGPDQAIMLNWGPPGVGSTVYIYWYSGGVDRGVLATGPSTLNNGDIIEAVLEGGIIYAKVNGVTVKSVANTTTLTSGTPGFITYGDVSLPGLVGILDDWEAGTPSSYAISGTITEDAAGLGGVLVTASGGFSGSATTDGSGAFTIEGVPANSASIVLTPTLAMHTMNPTTRTVVGPVTDNVTGQDFTSTANTSAVLTIQANHGSVTRNPDQPTYAFGTEVVLTPVPDSGYAFVGWNGDVPVGHAADNPLQVTMDDDRTIIATFVSLATDASDDFNRADETPLVVGGNWEQPFGGGSANLTGDHVVGDTGEALYYWQGGGTFDSTRQFARARVVEASGQAGLVLLGASGQALVAAWSGGTLYIYWYSDAVYRGNLTTASSALQNGDVIEALLDGGMVYARINGIDVASVENTTTLPAGRPGFETYLTGAVLDDWEAGTPPSVAPLQIVASAGPGGTITPSGTVSVSAGGSQTFAIAASGGYVIADVVVDGVSQGPLPSYAFTSLAADHTIAASFTGDPRSLAVNVVGGGTVTRSPDLPTYENGATVQLAADPATGWAFSAWSDDLAGTNNPENLLMDGAKTVTCTFLDIAPPTAALTSPNGAEVLFAGGSSNITWTASDNAAVTVVDVELSRAGAGGPYESIATGLANTGTFSWLVTTPITTNALVRITAHDAAGNTAQDLSAAEFSIAGTASVNDGPVAAFALSPLWPNPVRGSTRFQFALPLEANVHVGVHDVQGRELLVLADGVFPAGRHPMEWSNAAGATLRPGLYFIRMTVPGRTFVRRFVLIS